MTRGRGLAAPWRPGAPHNRALCRLLRFTGGALLIVAGSVVAGSVGAGSALAADPAPAQTPGHAPVAAPVQRAARSIRQSRPVTIVASSLDKVTVPPGSWVPLSVSVANKGPTDVEGQIVLTSNDAAATSAAGGCFANGPSTFTCLSSGDYSSGLSSAAQSSQAVGPARPRGSAIAANTANTGQQGQGTSLRAKCSHLRDPARACCRDGQATGRRRVGGAGGRQSERSR